VSGKNGTRALLLTAHCDDAELWAGGTIKLWVENGDQVLVAVATHNQVRRQETHSAAAILGFQPVFLEESLDLEDQFLEILEETRPEVVVTHPELDPHPLHRRVHSAVVSALTRLRERKEFPKRWYVFDSYYLTRTLPGCPILVDIRETLEAKRQALSCHQSQELTQLLRQAEHMGGLNGFRARVEMAEAFHPFDLLGRWPQLRRMP
jgi:LmbE family N-acetylglucosaminyl deacetylase